MIRLKVIGIGSPFQDDQLGWEVIRLLKLSNALARISNLETPQLQMICADRPGMRLLELMQGAETVILIDAVKLNGAIGTLHCFTADQLSGMESVQSSHSFGVAEAINMGKVLDLLPPKMFFYGIEIGSVSVDFTLTKSISKAIEELVVVIEALILRMK